MHDSPYAIATWRFEQIAPFVDPSLDRAARRRVMRERTRHSVPWPDGSVQPISRSTLHCWIRAYREGGLLALQPKPRSDRGTSRKDFSAAIDHAIALLYEQPNRSLYQLLVYLRAAVPDCAISRAHLSRKLKEHPAWSGIECLRGNRERRLRDLYQASHPHECWQLDGKGPFLVRLKSSERVRVHVLTVLDDHSRAVLAAQVSLAEDAKAATAVFQKAAARYGPPDRMQFDCGSGFDSKMFRDGLAQCGVHRNYVRAKHPQAQGKIEAYHRPLQRWFIDELPTQEVCDLQHLQQLLDAMLALVYQRHRHRALATTPEQKLAGRISERRISEHDLARAFFVDATAKSHAKTGEVMLPNGRFRVPQAHAGKRCQFRFDPLRARAVLITHDRRELELEPFVIKPLPPVDRERNGQGQLQRLVDLWRGTPRANAEPAFGLPEVFATVAELLGRSLPGNEREAREVLAFYKQHGPLSRRSFLQALDRTRAALGKGRPLHVYLEDLTRQIANAQTESHEQGEEQR